MMKDVGEWLSSIGLAQYKEAFEENDIDMEILPEIADDDLKEMGLTIGHRRRLLVAVRELAAETADKTARGATERQATQQAIADNPEHRQLTVLFCDLADSTRLSRTLDSEVLREITLAYQQACKQAIERNQGYIARYMGDGILAYFGYPQAHEDDAELAVKAGLAIVDAVAVLKDTVGRDIRISLGVRVGIATGPVIVGDQIGEGASRESAAVGETPNLAARLQNLASLNSVVVSSSTRRLIDGQFNMSSQGLRDLKGFSEPMESWHVVSSRTAEDQMEQQAGEQVTPLVGREEEAEILMRRWERSKQGRGQVVLLSGEPGIGKSRLVHYLRDNTDSSDHIRLRYNCSQHHTNSPLFPFIQQYEFAARFLPGDSDDEKLDKLIAMLNEMGDGDQSHLTLITSLLSISLPDRIPRFKGDSRKQRKETHEMFQDQLELLAGKAPVLIVFEDLHWIDPSSLELLDRLIERISLIPVMLVLTFRPEFHCPWIGLSHTTMLALTRLEKDEILEIVTSITAGKGFDSKTLEHIVSHTDGVPLFVEELSKMLIETGQQTGGVEEGTPRSSAPSTRPPETLRDSLTARLDRLGSSKSIAQICSVLGRQAEHSLLAKIADVSAEQLSESMSKLVSAGLMSCRGTPPHATYTFKHALIQDTAYQSMLSTRRSATHRRIADTIQEYFKEDLERRPEIIAHHYQKAERPQLALDYFEKAASRTLGRSNYAEGIHYLNQALEILSNEPESSQRDERELGVQTAMGGAMIATRGFAAQETGDTYARAAKLYQRIGGDTSRFNPVRYGVFVVHLVRSEFDIAYELAKEFVAVADRQENPTEHLVAHRILGTCQTFMGLWTDAVEHLDRAISLYDREIHSTLAVTYAQDPRIAALAMKSWSLLHLGQLDDAVAIADSAVNEAHEFGHLHTTAYTMGLAGTMLHQFRGDLEKTRAGADALVELCATQPVPLWSNLGLCLQGWAIGMEGDTEAGLRQIQDGYDGFVSTGARLFVPYYNTLMAELLVRQGHHDQAIEVLELAEQSLTANSEGWFAASFQRINGDLCSAMGLTARAEANYAAGQKLAQSSGDLLNQLRCCMGQAETAVTAVDRQAVSFQLKSLISKFSQGQDSIDLARARNLLESL